ncbi:class IV adenylate cyclase [Nocardia blacklockiae]|uniref:class IV adenylate cyclase n=1 Tax=Nocardia blacklockiae TaxID=480036 RepID=UPI0018939EC9|nr:CYTH domain-containing protein [Nocardia blacklockiae]MBF6174104.1 CYTH domain-containing protein [Nocardia blacklockiae]
MIEAEYKARLGDPDVVRANLRQRARSENVSYRDVYFDRGNELGQAGRDFRLRTIIGEDETRYLLTFKDSAVDSETASKPEFETVIGEREPMEEIIARLGYLPVMELTKQCENFRFVSHGRKLLATVVTVPEIEGTFLELETQATEENLRAVLRDLRMVLAELGVSEDELTAELYTDAVAEARRRLG